MFQEHGHTYLSPSEVMQLTAQLGAEKSDWWIRARSRDGKLIAYRVGGDQRRKFYRKDEVEALFKTEQEQDVREHAPPASEEDDLLTFAEVAKHLGVTQEYIHHLRAEGAIEAVNIARPGAKQARWRVEPGEYARFVRERTEKKEQVGVK